MGTNRLTDRLTNQLTDRLTDKAGCRVAQHATKKALVFYKTLFTFELLPYFSLLTIAITQ